MDHLNAYDSLFAVNDNDVLLVLMKPVLDLFADFQEKLEWRWSLIFNSEKPNSIFKDFWRGRSSRFSEHLKMGNVFHYHYSFDVVHHNLQVDEIVMAFVLLFEKVFQFFNLVPSRMLLTLFVVGWVGHCNHAWAYICKEKEAVCHVISRATLIYLV